MYLQQRCFYSENSLVCFGKIWEKFGFFLVHIQLILFTFGKMHQIFDTAKLKKN